MSWQRSVKNRSLEYWRISNNGISSSEEETYKKTRDSQYVRYLFRVKILARRFCRLMPKFAYGTYYPRFKSIRAPCQPPQQKY